MMLVLHVRGLRFVLLPVALSLLLAVARAQDVPATQPAASCSQNASGEVEALLAGLADPHWHVRNRSVERLVELGASAERKLVAARDSASTVDFRTRVEMILSRIHESRRWGPTYVSLHLKNAAPRDALLAMATEAGVKIQSGALSLSHPISLDADHQPFWCVFRNLCSQAQLEIGAIDSSGTSLRLEIPI